MDYCAHETTTLIRVTWQEINEVTKEVRESATSNYSRGRKCKQDVLDDLFSALNYVIIYGLLCNINSSNGARNQRNDKRLRECVTSNYPRGRKCKQDVWGDSKYRHGVK